MYTLPPKAEVASFDVDAQRSFTPLCPEELPAAGGHEIADELNAQAKFASLRIGSKDAHPADAIWLATPEKPQLSPVHGHLHVDVHWKPHAMTGSEGFKLIPGLPHVTEYDFFIWKGIEPDLHPYGNCYHDSHEKLSTGLIEFLRGKKISTVIIGGLVTDFCVKVTAFQIVKEKFLVIVNLGSCR
jgi:nicotinamidase/pyrazinamidase